MAPNGHAPSDQQPVDHISQSNSPPIWHERHGSAEFKHWKTQNPTEHLSYEDWKTSKHAEGLALYYTTLHLWDESDSSDEEVERAPVKSRPRGIRGRPAHEPKKTFASIGNGVPRTAESATSSPVANSETPSTSARKKRKMRKKYVSEEFVASDGDSGGATSATPVNGTATPTAPAIEVNGRRKSSSRKPRKKPLSEEIISPEDEEDDPMETSTTVAHAIRSPLPVRSGSNPTITSKSQPEPHKKTILKLSTRKAPKKKVLSEETVRDDETDDDRSATAAFPSHVSTSIEPSGATTPKRKAVTNGAVDANATDEDGTPDPSSAASRRGLRTRRPAQQHPYSHDNILFGEHDTDIPTETPIVQQSPSERSRRPSIISLREETGGNQNGELDEETLAILQGLQGAVEPEFERADGRPKHFKGKGRAWKKEESDEDMEFNPAKKKAHKAKLAKAKAAKDSTQPPKKRGRPRKSNVSDAGGDISKPATPVKTEDASTSAVVLEGPAKRVKRQPRKSALSEEIVRDDTESEIEQADANQPTESLQSKASTPVVSKQCSPTRVQKQVQESIEEQAPTEIQEQNNEPIQELVPQPVQEPLNEHRDEQEKDQVEETVHEQLSEQTIEQVQEETLHVSQLQEEVGCHEQGKYQVQSQAQDREQDQEAKIRSPKGILAQSDNPNGEHTQPKTSEEDIVAKHNNGDENSMPITKDESVVASSPRAEEQTASVEMDVDSEL